MGGPNTAAAGPGRAKGAAAGLAAERELLAALVEAIPAGVIALEAASGRLVLANDEARRIFGEPELVLRAPDDHGRWRALRPDGSPYGAEDWPVLGSMRRGEPVDGELFELQRDDGSSVVLEARSARLPGVAGGPELLVAVFQDVSERARLDRAQREFVTNAAHELLTPLAAITSALEVLQAGAKDEPAERERFLAHAERETERLGRLSRALLVLARAQAGTEAPRGELIPVRALLEELVSGLRPYPGVEVSVDCPDDLALLANRELSVQALANVAENAAKFTTAGAIGVRARREEDGCILIEIRDTGPGVPAADAARVFERFYRARSRPGEGFGLGLAIARQAVEALGGTIGLRSGEGRGTTIEVTLPGARLVRR